MKQINTLLVRMSALSLALATMQVGLMAVPKAKDDKASAAAMSALVQQKAAQDAAAKTLYQPPMPPVTTPPTPIPSDWFDRSVRIGSPINHQHLCVYDYVRAGGDITSGHIAVDSTEAGLKHIIGIAKLDPRTQQFQIMFKDKTDAALGAFVDLDFVTTVTCHKMAVKDVGIAKNVVRAHDIYCHPRMDAAQIMGTLSDEQASGLINDLTANGGFTRSATTWPFSSSALVNPSPNFVYPGFGVETGYLSGTPNTLDVRLTLTVRVENLTRNVNFGFVPVSITSYPTVTSDSSNRGFYESNWATNANNGGKYPVYGEGTLAYQVKSDCVSRVGVVTETSDSLDIPDLFDLFTEDQLASLCDMLQDHFNNQEDMCRYIRTHRFALSRAFNVMQ